MARAYGSSFDARSKLNRRATTWWEVLKMTYHDWTEDRAPRLGAALAYYTVFSLAPLLLIVISIAGLVFDPAEVQTAIDHQLEGLLGAEGKEGVSAMVAGAQNKDSGIVATVLGVVALLFGATGVFAQLKDSLNTIWEVEAKPGQGIWQYVRDRFLSFAMVLTIGFLLLVMLVVSAGLAVLLAFFNHLIPLPEWSAYLIDAVVSFGAVTMLFAMMFKYLPDVKIAWGDVWLGAAFTALLFTVGKYALGLYLGQAGFGSTYGAAGAVVIILLWAYYSSQILFFGAEFTQVYARSFGGRILPAENAQPVTPEARAKQGMSPAG